MIGGYLAAVDWKAVIVAAAVLAAIWLLTRPPRRPAPRRPVPSARNNRAGHSLRPLWSFLKMVLFLILIVKGGNGLLELSRRLRPETQGPSPTVASEVPAGGIRKKAPQHPSVPIPSVHPYLDFEAMAFYDRGEYRQAIALFRQLCEAEPRNGWARFLLAWSYWKAGKPVPANQQLRHACRLGYDQACRLARQTCRAGEPGACGTLSPLPPAPAPDRTRPVELVIVPQPARLWRQLPADVSVAHEQNTVTVQTRLTPEGLRLDPLPAATYQVTLHLDKDGDDLLSPGDGFFQNRIPATPAHAVVQVSPARILHLLEPLNNANPLPEEPDSGQIGVAEYSSPLYLAWTPLDLPGIRYHYAVIASRDSALTYERVLAAGVTSKPEIRLDLPITPAGQADLLLLTAYRNGRIVGLLATHSQTRSQVGLRFRIRSAPPR